MVAEVLRRNPDVDLVGLVDSNQELWGTHLHGLPILGGDDLLRTLQQQGVTHFFVGVGMVNGDSPRRRLFERACAQGLEPISAVHERATVSPHATLGRGVTILAGAIVNHGARLGDNVVVNTGAIVEHDCTVGAHSHIATGARLSGGVVVGEGAHVGVGASVKQGISIGAAAVVGVGAAVVHPVAAGVTVVGVPARPLSRADRSD